MTDIAPELYESIVNTYNQLCNGDRILADLRKQIQNGTATYRQAYQYAERCGMHLSGVLHAVLKEENLPNGTLYYNIAEKTLGQALHMNAEQILNMVRRIQETINEKAGVKLKPVEVAVNEDRIHEIVSAAANAETYEKAAVQFDEPVITESRRAVDDSLKANARFHDKAGLEVRVEREYDGVGLHDGTDACEWCLERAGSFTYDKAMAVGAFERHEGCGCIIDYTSKKGVTTRSTGKNGGWEERKARQNRIEAGEDISNVREAPEKYIDNSGKKQYSISPQDIKHLQEVYERDVDEGWISPLSGFDNYLRLYQEIERDIVGKSTVNGIIITGISDHFMQRVLGTAVDPEIYKEKHEKRSRSGVLIEDIKDALFNGNFRDPQHYDNGISQRFNNSNCVVTVNPVTGNLIQCNPRKKK